MGLSRIDAVSTIAAAVAVGVSIGAAGATAIHAQQIKTPPAYVIAEVEERIPPKIVDPAASRRYAEEAPKTLAPFHGRYIVRGGGEIQTVEGEAPKGYVVVIAFDSTAKAREWYDSPAYEAIKSIRQRSTKSRIFIVEGVAPQ
jgi:uncharacterized protein (DUF1330 family)